MPGPTLQQRLDILLDHLAEAEREYAAGVPYPDHTVGSWPEKIAGIKKRITTLREMIGGWPIHQTHPYLGCPIHAVSSHDWAFAQRANRFSPPNDKIPP
jgi:hypothetical protein